jgi:hypothetical protein
MPVRVALVDMPLEIARHLRLQRLDQHPAGTLPGQLVQTPVLDRLFPRVRVLD